MVMFVGCGRFFGTFELFLERPEKKWYFILCLILTFEAEVKCGAELWSHPT